MKLSEAYKILKPDPGELTMIGWAWWLLAAPLVILVMALTIKSEK